MSKDADADHYLQILEYGAWHKSKRGATGDAEGMQVMLVLGNNMAFWLNCKNVVMKMGLSMPEEPEFTYTNFIH